MADYENRLSSVFEEIISVVDDQQPSTPTYTYADHDTKVLIDELIAAVMKSFDEAMVKSGECNWFGEMVVAESASSAGGIKPHSLAEQNDRVVSLKAKEIRNSSGELVRNLSAPEAVRTSRRRSVFSSVWKSVRSAGRKSMRWICCL